MTVNEIVKQIDDSLASIEEQQVTKENSFDDIVGRAIGAVPPPLAMRAGEVVAEVPFFGSVARVRILTAYPLYRADKRTYNGLSNKLIGVSTRRNEDIPGDMDLSHLASHLLRHLTAENKSRLEREIAELRGEIAEREAAIADLDALIASGGQG